MVKGRERHRARRVSGRKREKRPLLTSLDLGSVPGSWCFHPFCHEVRGGLFSRSNGCGAHAHLRKTSTTWLPTTRTTYDELR